MMPNDKVEKETDGNPKTLYEDKSEHERVGFRADDSKLLNNDPPTEKISDGYDI